MKKITKVIANLYIPEKKILRFWTLRDGANNNVDLYKYWKFIDDCFLDYDIGTTYGASINNIGEHCLHPRIIITKEFMVPTLWDKFILVLLREPTKKWAKAQAEGLCEDSWKPGDKAFKRTM